MQTVIFIAVVCLVLTVMGATLAIAFSGSRDVGARVRRRLAERLRVLPFYRLLCRRKVDVARHLAETPVEALEKELKNCEVCPNVRQCDEVLARPEGEEMDYSFCPNEPAIREMEKNKAEP